MAETNQTKNIIAVDHLDKRFGKIHAVQDLTFRVKQGELFAFLGVNGAGKSTTIHMMCAQLPKDSGTIVIDQHNLDQDASHMKRILGVVFQNSVLDSTLSVYDNLESRAALTDSQKKRFMKDFKPFPKCLPLMICSNVLWENFPAGNGGASTLQDHYYICQRFSSWTNRLPDLIRKRVNCSGMSLPN